MMASSNKDYNYQEILKTSKRWRSNRMQYEFMDVKGMGRDVTSRQCRNNKAAPHRAIGVGPENDHVVLSD